MAKSSKLLSALERRTGRNINLEKQRKQEKAAAKRKAKHNGAPDAEDAVIGVDDKLDGEDNGDWEDEEEAEGEHTKVRSPDRSSQTLSCMVLDLIKHDMKCLRS
jgi:hypothetical protein